MFKAMTMVGDIRGAFEKAVQVEPKNREARFALFGFYSNAPSVAGGGSDKALALAEQTLAQDAALGHYFKGLLLQKQKNNGAAQAEYRQSQAADPRFAPTCNALGYIELEQKHVDQALEQFRKQVELEPDNANSYDSLGDGWMAKGRLDEAINAYRKALALNPMFPSSMRSLGTALEQAGRRDEAIQHYRHCAQLGAQNGVAKVVTESKTRLNALGVKE
jgi:tetratricopeptide (TPR) repeat protein